MKNKFLDLGGLTIVVSGYPRSGTSSMMRVLRFAGIELLTSKHTEESQTAVDPHGILELTDVGVIRTEPPEFTMNKAVKIVAPYIDLVPRDRPVKVLFMTRPINEIVVSLFVQRNLWEDDPWTCIPRARKHLETIGVPVLYVDYHELLKYPKSTVSGIKGFLDLDFDVTEAIKGVEKDPRGKAAFDKKKIIKAGKSGFYEDFKTEVLVLNDPNYEIVAAGPPEVVNNPETFDNPDAQKKEELCTKE